MSLNFHRKTFFDAMRSRFGPIKTQSKVDGLESILSSMEADQNLTDLRHAAYMLATTKLECADEWRPIEEFGRGKGMPYGKAFKVVAPDGREFMNSYYGRGYVQLTWQDNYARADRRLNFSGDESLLLHPERALLPEVAYKIMSMGMREGMFTSRRLDHYINGSRCDYVNARRIINGTDKAQLIATYAEGFEQILRASVQSFKGS